MSLHIDNQQKPAIYLNSTYLDVPVKKVPEHLKAPEKIGDIWARMAKIYQSEKPELKKDLIPLLARLGVSKTDEDAHRTLIPLIGKALSDQVQIFPAEGNAYSGVYFMNSGKESHAVFKVGTRACTETFARRFGEKFQLKNVIPGVYCSIIHPTFPRAEMPVELYNGNELVYEYQDGTGKTLTGIFEPFIPGKAFVQEGEKMSHEQFLYAVLLAILLGAEDIKDDGIAEDLFFDIEKVMRPQPGPKQDYNKSLPTLHLPFVECELGKQKIPKELLTKLFAKIKAIKLPELHVELSKEKIMYPDLIAEQTEPVEISDEEGVDEDAINDLYPKFKDQGNCTCFVRTPFEKSKKSVRINPKDEDSFSLFSDSQILGCMSRINLLREFIAGCIEKDIEPTAIDLMKAADPLYAAQYENFSTTPTNKRRLDSPVPFIGNTTLSAWGGKLTKDQIAGIQSTYSRSSSPEQPGDSPIMRRASISVSSTEELLRYIRTTPRNESGSGSNNPFSREEKKEED